MRNSITIIALILLLSGCSANWHLNQAKRHERAAMIKGAVIQTDTVWVESPVYVKEIVQDTLLLTTQGDTIYIERDRLKIKFVDLPGDSVFIEGKCEADTVVVKVPVKVEKVIYAPDKGLKWWQFILIGAGGMIVLYFIIRK